MKRGRFLSIESVKLMQFFQTENPLKDEGARSLSDLLKVNTTLTSLSLSSYPVIVLNVGRTTELNDMNRLYC